MPQRSMNELSLRGTNTLSQEIHSEFIAVCSTFTMSAFKRMEKGNPVETECKDKGLRIWRRLNCYGSEVYLEAPRTVRSEDG
jgi:hypothetical protein